MSHVSLTVVLREGQKNPAHAVRKRTIAQAGGLHIDGGTPYEPVARTLSKLPWVDRVIATYVTETNVGVFRKGSKS